MNNNIIKLQSSLVETIEAWMQQESVSQGWDDLETFVGDNTASLMGASAFNVLLAQSDLTKFLEKEKHLVK